MRWWLAPSYSTYTPCDLHPLASGTSVIVDRQNWDREQRSHFLKVQGKKKTILGRLI